MSTPNYLGFLKTAPKEGPLQSAISGAMNTYGDVQKLMQQTELTQALPTQLEQQKKLGEQKLTEGEQAIAKGNLEAKYLPQQLEDEAQLRHLLVQSYPKDISLKQNAQELENILSGLKVQTGNMGVDQLKDQMRDAELSKIYETGLNYKDALPDQLNISKKKLGSFGIDIPDQITPDLWAQAKRAHDTAQAMSPFTQKLTEITLKRQVDANIAQLKNANNMQKKFDETTGTDSANWFGKDLPTSVSAADDILRSSANLRNVVHKNEWAFGIGTSRLLYLSDPQREAATDTANLQLDKYATTPGASRGSKALLTVVKESKVDRLNDSPETIYRKLNQIDFAGNLIKQESEFANTLRSKYGIIDKGQLENSWEKFTQSLLPLAKEGKLMPDMAFQWSKYFSEHPEDLPYGVLQRVQDSKNLPLPNKNYQYAEAGPVMGRGGTTIATPESVFAGTGLIPKEVSAKNLLTG